MKKRLNKCNLIGIVILIFLIGGLFFGGTLLKKIFLGSISRITLPSPVTDSYQSMLPSLHGIDDNQDVSESIPSLAEPPKNEPILQLEDDLTGTFIQTIKIGEKYAAVITASFQYELEKNGYVITSISEASAKSQYGWQYVNPDAVINEENTVIQDEGTYAIVSVTYYASTGEGLRAYDTLVKIDLSNLN